MTTGRPDDVEGWTVSLRSAGRSRTTIRAYQNALAMFCDYVCDARYGWVAECEERFGEHPVQICHEWNTADHVADYEGAPGRRPFTQVGHSHAATTAIYTSVSTDYRNRVLRTALDRAFASVPKEDTR